MNIGRKINSWRKDSVKNCCIKGVITILVLALCVGTVSVVRADAASRPAKPKYKLLKRQKKSATLKVSNSKGITGYRIYLKTGKKGKWMLYDFALHSSKIKIAKLKPDKVYYVRLRAWKTRGHSVRLSSYSRTIKINKYKKKTGAAPTSTPTLTPMPTLAPAPGEGSVTSGSAVSVPVATATPSPSVTPIPSASALPAPAM